LTKGNSILFWPTILPSTSDSYCLCEMLYSLLPSISHYVWGPQPRRNMLRERRRKLEPERCSTRKMKLWPMSFGDSSNCAGERDHRVTIKCLLIPRTDSY
jgi:hypothetical protein